MLMSLKMTTPDPAIRGARVQYWSKQIGEPFDFGDELCVVVIDEVLALRKTQSASLLTGSRRRRKRVRDEVETRDVGGLLIQLVASEPGVIRETCVDIGEVVSVGEVLAILETVGEAGSSDPEGSIDNLLAIRVVANSIEAEEL